MSDNPTQTPPGWYPNQHGQTQWWDGQAWGPNAPQQQAPVIYAAPHPGTKSVGVAYVLLLFLGGTGAHRFYLRNTGHAVVFLVIFLLYVVSSVVELSQGAPGPSVLLLVVLWLLMVVDLFILAKDVRAYNARLWRVPVA